MKMKEKIYGAQNLTIEQMHSNRQVADRAGHSHYFLGVPCKHGHVAPRLVSTSACVECNSMHYQRRVTVERKQREKKRAQIIEKLKKEDNPHLFGPDKLKIIAMKSNKHDALKAGHSHYFTGKKCKHGHVAPRTTGNSTCVFCARRHSMGYRNKIMEQLQKA